MRKATIIPTLFLAILGISPLHAADKQKTATSEFRDAMKGYLPVTDRSKTISLNGSWNLKVVQGVTSDKTVPEADASWEKIPVPGCWEAYGRCKPTYNYPDSITGYYRTSFDIPQSWRKDRVVLRLDGVLRGYDLYINDQYAGTWESAYNTCLWDITPYLAKGSTQKLSMRVYSRFMGYEFDCFDDWTPMGIFRDVTLMSIPEMHLRDMKIETESISQDSDGRWNATMLFAFMNSKKARNASVDVALISPSGKTIATRQLSFAASDSVVWQPQLDDILPWTAETPDLYKIVYSLKSGKKTLQTFSQNFGIRKLTIEGKILKINGRQVKFRGVNGHATDPQTVKVISDERTLKDLRQMKEASINYIRTSHYPREPRFYDLCDSLGFYVVDEVPFGRGEKISRKGLISISCSPEPPPPWRETKTEPA